MVKGFIFDTEAEAISVEATISSRGKDLYSVAEYGIVNEHVVPKRASDGKDLLAAQHLMKWDNVKLSPTGKYWIYSPSARYSDVYDQLVDGLGASEQDIPEEWYNPPED